MPGQGKRSKKSKTRGEADVVNREDFQRPLAYARHFPYLFSAMSRQITRLKLAFAACLLAAPAAAQETIALRCGRVIDGQSAAATSHVTILVRDGRIVALEREGRVPDGARVVELTDRTCLPGMIDLHAHLVSRNRYAPLTVSSAAKALDALRSAQILLRSGFTTIRTLGEPDAYYIDADVRDAIARGDFEGPRMFVAPHMLSSTGGHGDRGELAPDLDIELPARVVDGPDALRKAVRTEIKGGADWIKAAATGGVMSASDDPRTTAFTNEELHALVDETHRHGKKITVHAIGTAGIKAAVRAGVDNVEHGILIDEEGIALMKEKGTWLVPTIYVLNYVVNEGPRLGYRPESIAKGRALIKERDARIRAAFAAGVKVGFGSDNIFPHQDSAREFAEMVRLGLSPMEAIRSATGNAAQLLGIQNDVGTLEMGKIADIIAVDGNPLDDIRILEQVPFVLQGGKVVHDEGGRAGSILIPTQ